MNISRLPSLGNSMESAAMLLAAGSKTWDCEPKMAGPAKKPLTKDSSVNEIADYQEPISGSGTPSKPEPFLKDGPFSIRQSGNIGQEILDPDGKIIAWTTDGWIAQVICKLLTDNEELLFGGERHI